VRDFQREREREREEKATQSPLSSARIFPGPLCTTTYIDRESVPGQRRERESEEGSRGRSGYMDVCAIPTREPRKKLQLSPPLSHMVATLPFPRRDVTMPLSLYLPRSLALPLPPILV